MKSLVIGVLAEDQTDCLTVAELIRRIADGVNAAAPGIKRYSGKGCAKLRKHAERRLSLMVDDGCRAVVLVHDLDRNTENGQLNDERVLRHQLSMIQVPAGLAARFCIVIPVEELEAWFWADEDTVQKATRRNPRAKAHPSPDRIPRPKEAFERFSSHKTGRVQYDTTENVELAKVLDLRKCADRCPSFQQLCQFVRMVVVK